MGGDPGCSSALDPDERGVTAVATGVAHSCAILDDATVRCWGPNTSGELGYEDILACLGGASLLGLRRVTNLGSLPSELEPALPLVPLW
jgi:alpha-tubulin suppressor-like RCC1 family protein